ncbi:MAG: choice-of-anchor V domain-containing protein [Acidobacteriota bacterium]
MRVITGRSAIVKSTIVIAAVGVFVAYFIFGDGEKVGASASGPSPSHTGAPAEDNCTACHTSYPVDSGDGSVSITGVPINYTPGQQVPITVKTAQSDATIYGFQLTAINASGQTVGTFTLPSQNPSTMQLVDNIIGGQIRVYVEHTVDGLFTNNVFGSNSWTFTWTAPNPSAGTVFFYAAGNAANSDGTPTGDYIYTTTATTTPLTSVSISGKVTSPDNRPLRNTKIILTDQGGSFLMSTVTSAVGLYSFEGIPPGQYTLKAVSKLYRFTPKPLNLTTDLTNVDFVGQE